MNFHFNVRYAKIKLIRFRRQEEEESLQKQVRAGALMRHRNEQRHRNRAQTFYG